MLPAIDLSDDRKKVIEELLDAVCNYGAFYVKTSFSKAEYDELFGASANLFALSQETKLENQVKPGGFTRGFIRMGAESGSLEYELKEGFSYGYPLTTEPKNKLQGFNVWPKNIDENTKTVLEQFYLFNSRLSQTLAGMLSEGLTGSQQWLEHCKDGDTISLMRLFHYFPSTNPKSLGSSPHTDWGFLTLIKAKEDIPSLQIAKKGEGDEWMDVPAFPDGDSEPWAWFIVNAGDFMSMISNGNCKSPLHRVVSTSCERTSFVYFAYPSFESRVPSFRSDKLSLFHDQKVVTRKVEPTNDCFGDFIYKKWEQVSRY